MCILIMIRGNVKISVCIQGDYHVPMVLTRLKVNLVHDRELRPSLNEQKKVIDVVLTRLGMTGRN